MIFADFNNDGFLAINAQSPSKKETKIHKTINHGYKIVFRKNFIFSEVPEMALLILIMMER